MLSSVLFVAGGTEICSRAEDSEAVQPVTAQERSRAGKQLGKLQYSKLIAGAEGEHCGCWETDLRDSLTSPCPFPSNLCPLFLSMHQSQQ